MLEGRPNQPVLNDHMERPQACRQGEKCPANPPRPPRQSPSNCSHIRGPGHNHPAEPFLES